MSHYVSRIPRYCYGKVLFKGSLGLPVGRGVFRAHRHPPKAQSGQISAYRALMKFDAENHLDPTREIHRRQRTTPSRSGSGPSATQVAN